ncbi:MAG TPA: hypothetical protein VFR97_13300 [Capillimicrobium sp.]|nr:hypothetical protein [Capillimicrobium sp.]
MRPPVHPMRDLERDDPLWPGQLATLVAIALFFVLPDTLSLGPRWPLPVLELAVLATLMLTRGRPWPPSHRATTIVLVLVAALANLVALGLLVRELLSGGHPAGADLLGGGVVIWATSLLLFAVLYWELDRGGPLRPGGPRAVAAVDFLFPQMTQDRYGGRGWKPGFADYLYVSLTNQTAFSPTDTMPLTVRAKGLMAVQALAAFVTAGVLVAHAVNQLG